MELRETAGVPTTEFSQEFVQGMLDRMGMSFFKYGAVADGFGPKGRFDALECAKQRIEAYLNTGNIEYLMDAGNFVMIAFMFPKHPEAHFRSTDSTESPGRVMTSGHITQNANTTGGENVRRGGSNRVTSGGFYKNEGD